MNGIWFKVKEQAPPQQKATAAAVPLPKLSPAFEVYDPNKAHCLAQLAALVYRPDDYVWANISKFFRLPLLDCAWYDREDTQTVVAVTEDVAVVVFRGTESLEDVITDLQCDLVGVHCGRVHRGFLRAMEAIWFDVAKQLASLAFNQRIFIAGHSLGAAVATLFAWRLRMQNIPVAGLYTFGSPRVGDKDFADFFNAVLPRTWRHVNNNDVVCRVPLLCQQYQHVGQLKYFDEKGRVHDSLTLGQRLHNLLAGLWFDKFELGADAMKDHGIANYENVLRANVSST